MKNVPNAAWVCLTVAFVAVVGAFVVLSATRTDTTEFYRFLNVVGNLAGVLLGGGGLVYAGAAARNSERAAEQTNGQLDDRIAQGVARALAVQRAADTQPGGEFRRE